MNYSKDGRWAREELDKITSCKIAFVITSKYTIFQSAFNNITGDF
jgi:hypothetical protein